MSKFLKNITLHLSGKFLVSPKRLRDERIGQNVESQALSIAMAQTLSKFLNVPKFDFLRDVYYTQDETKADL